MTPVPTTPSEIIDACGGTSEVAALCEVTPSAVTQWRKDRIPRARLMFLKLVRPEVFGADRSEIKNPESAHE